MWKKEMRGYMYELLLCSIFIITLLLLLLLLIIINILIVLFLLLLVFCLIVTNPFTILVFLFFFFLFLFCFLLLFIIIKSGDGGHRSHCPFHAKEMLYHLSYIPIPFLSFSNPTSFELYSMN